MSNQVVVQARQFQVLDRQGRVRAVLGMIETQEDEVEAAPEKPVLQFRRTNDSVALQVDLYPEQAYDEFDNEMTEEGASIALYTGEDTRRLRIWMTSDHPDCPSIALFDSEGRHKLVVTVDDSPYMSLSDGKGHPHWTPERKKRHAAS